jgi:hypothetical protein
MKHFILMTIVGLASINAKASYGIPHFSYGSGISCPITVSAMPLNTNCPFHVSSEVTDRNGVDAYGNPFQTVKQYSDSVECFHWDIQTSADVVAVNLSQKSVVSIPVNYPNADYIHAELMGNSSFIENRAGLRTTVTAWADPATQDKDLNDLKSFVNNYFSNPRVSYDDAAKKLTLIYDGVNGTQTQVANVDFAHGVLRQFANFSISPSSSALGLAARKYSIDIQCFPDSYTQR